MLGNFTKIAVGNPYLLAQTAWENLPPSEKTPLAERDFKSQEWAPLDRRRFRIEPESYRTEALMANVGALRLSRVTHNRAKDNVRGARGWWFCSLDDRARHGTADPSWVGRTGDWQCHDGSDL